MSRLHWFILLACPPAAVLATGQEMGGLGLHLFMWVALQVMLLAAIIGFVVAWRRGALRRRGVQILLAAFALPPFIADTRALLHQQRMQERLREARALRQVLDQELATRKPGQLAGLIAHYEGSRMHFDFMDQLGRTAGPLDDADRQALQKLIERLRARNESTYGLEALLNPATAKAGP
jgi:hypothetical protein